MELRYRILNVFTAGGARLSGNPLCVFEDGSQLDGTQMQALARQFNLSETTFILPSKRGSAQVRIFTPAFEMRAGIIPVTASGDHWTLRATASTSRLVDAKPAELATLLGLETGDIGF